MRVRDPDFDAALKKIDVENYLEQSGYGFKHSYGSSGQQLILDECPFCSGGDGKTYVNAKTGLGNCFHGSCGKKFNLFSLMMQISKLRGNEFNEYVIGTASNMGWIPKKIRPEIVRKNLELPEGTVPLNDPKRRLKYLTERGVSAQSCADFMLSYCHCGVWRYTNGTEENLYMRFDRRVVIPVFDLDGTLVSFQGRDITGESPTKYLFPPGYAVAGKQIYNAETFDDLRHTHAVLTEGVFDAIAVSQALRATSGCEHIIPVASFGMHLSGGPDGQLQRFGTLRDRGLKTVTIMWDSEQKAISQAVKSGFALKGIGLDVRIAVLPPGYDPAQGPDKSLTPPETIIKSIFTSGKLDKSSAIKILVNANGHK